MGTAENRFDLIITDCNIPGMDGFAFTRLLRQREAELGIKPVVIVGLTASAEKRSSSAARRLA